jgi:serine phosphatase RsbU (regulator of sigma subunit)
MRIRTQLILAAFVLAVVPLAAIVTYSYHSSRRALESAYRREAERLTQQMDRRLATIRTDLDQRLRFVSALPLPGEHGSGAEVGNIVTVMGDSASLVDALDFEPVRIDPRELARMQQEAEADAARAEQEQAEVPPSPSTPQVAAVAPVPPAAPVEPVVIDLPPMPEMPRFVLTEEQQEMVAEIARLGEEIGKPDLDPEERQDIRRELQTAQDELRRVVEADHQKYRVQIAAAQGVRNERMRAIQEARRAWRQAHPRPANASGPAPVPAPAVVPQVKARVDKAVQSRVREATAKDIAKAAATARKTALILGRNFEAPVRQQGEVVGQLSARVSPDQVINRVLGSAIEDRSEVPFALDREGTLYTRNDVDRALLDRLGVTKRLRGNQSLKGIEGWIVSAQTDPQSGLRIGVARPVGDNFDDLRSAAARNFGIGVGLIAFALIGIVPLSNHLTRDVKLVTDGAERIAHGDLMTRLPVKTNNELGQLARAFNQMAEDLSLQQEKLVQQERARKEQELQQRLMSVEYERKSVELEDARRFQLSMLPKEVPRHPDYDVAVFTRTATEVGGDYYDFHLAGDTLSVTIGDATGHGAKAGTMVTVVKTLFSGYGGVLPPAEFLRDAAEKIKRMDLGRMAMALSLARFHERTLTLSSAGMPPVLIHRAAQGVVEEIALEATPLGTMDTEYPQQVVALEGGDTVLFLSDGFPELMNDAGQQLGYPGALDTFASAASAANADGVIAALAEATGRWHGDAPPNDDVTFVVVRVA